jgi:hypothetical protein
MVPGPGLDADDEISIGPIFGDHDAERARGRDDVIDRTCRIGP